jgi:hypothetical protein
VSKEKGPDSRSLNGKSLEDLGDFTTTLRVLPISGLAIVIGAVCAVVALVLLRLIGLFTNLFYFGRWSTAMVSPVGNHLGIYSEAIDSDREGCASGFSSEPRIRRRSHGTLVCAGSCARLTICRKTRNQ